MRSFERERGICQGRSREGSACQVSTRAFSRHARDAQRLRPVTQTVLWRKTRISRKRTQSCSCKQLTSKLQRWSSWIGSHTTWVALVAITKARECAEAYSNCMFKWDSLFSDKTIDLMGPPPWMVDLSKLTTPHWFICLDDQTIDPTCSQSEVETLWAISMPQDNQFFFFFFLMMSS